ncbi:MAG: acyltransferase family protein [Eisenbergiella sp.]
MNSKLTEKRDYLFDNPKPMLFLVVIGHILDPYIERQDSLYRYLMQYIYLFHMPMFAFITGYFTKNTEKARNSAVRNVLVPYIFWQLLYIITALLFIRLGLASYNTDVFKPSLLLPSSPLYYLLCVFVWKVFAADLKKLRFPVLFSFAAGLFISVVFDEAFHIGWGACFSLMIFFAGSFMYERTRRENQNIPHAIAAAIPPRYTIRPAALQLSECPFYL